MFRIMCITDHGNGRFVGHFILYGHIDERWCADATAAGLTCHDRNSGITNTRYSVW